MGDTKDAFAVAYVDDVLVFPETFAEYLGHLCIAIKRMREAGLILIPGKVQLAFSRVMLLRYVVDGGIFLLSE